MIEIKSKELELRSKQYNCDLKGIFEIAITDIAPFFERLPKNYSIGDGIIGSPTAIYNPEKDELQINLFSNLVMPVFGKRTNEERDIALRGYFNHESFEALNYSPASDEFKRVMYKFHSALTSQKEEIMERTFSGLARELIDGQTSIMAFT